jgi:two-component system sensor histidine kinase SenX3
VVYSPEGGSVSVSIDRVEATLDEDGEAIGPFVLVAVKDQGVGIPSKDLERIFERFYRVDPGRARETGGTGLGLSIVRHVAQNHGGNVLVDSREGEGSTFSLELPMNQR